MVFLHAMMRLCFNEFWLKKKGRKVYSGRLWLHMCYTTKGLLLRRSLLRSLMMEKRAKQGTNGGSEEGLL